RARSDRAPRSRRSPDFRCSTSESCDPRSRGAWPRRGRLRGSRTEHSAVLRTGRGCGGLSLIQNMPAAAPLAPRRAYPRESLLLLGLLAAFLAVARAGGRLVRDDGSVGGVHLDVTILIGCREGELPFVDRGFASETLRLDLGRALLGLVDLDLQVEEEADRFLLDLAHHGLVHRVSLALVLDQRVALRHGTQADAVLEVVHLVEVVSPAAVDDLQHNAALELAHRLGSEGLLALAVGDLRVAEDLLREALLVDAALASARLGDDLFDRDPHGVQRLE